MWQRAIAQYRFSCGINYRHWIKCMGRLGSVLARVELGRGFAHRGFTGVERRPRMTSGVNSAVILVALGEVRVYGGVQHDEESSGYPQT